jgi:hypothetical protein
MEPDDSSFTPSSSNRGHGGQQRQFPFQGEYEHTANTPKRRRLDESQSPAQCQPYYNDMPTPQASLPMPSKSQTPRFTPFSLLPVNEQGPQNISELDALICQNVELFQSYAEEGPQSAQLGLRCVHCARAMQRHVDSCIIFPSSVETMENSVRIIKERHFPSCETLPINARETFNRLHSSKNESSQGHFSLSQFLQTICRKSNIVNRQPVQTGIVRADLSFEPVSYHHGDSTNTSYARSDALTQKSSPTYTDPAHSSASTAVPYSPLAQKPHQQHHHNTLYENTNTNAFPFLQTAPNIWECRNCLNLPIGHRGKRYAWYAPTPPNKAFMEDHLRLCSGVRQIQQQNFQSQNQQISYASQHQQQNYQLQNQPYSSTSTYHPTQQINRPYQDQMQMKSPFQSSQSQHNFSVGSLKQQYRSPQPAPTTHPYQNSYQQTHPWRPSLPQTGFSSSNQQMMPSLANASHFSTPSKDSGAYQYGDYNQGPRSNPGTSFAKDELENSMAFLNKMEAVNRGDEVDLLVEETDRHLITDYFYHVMKQLRICHFKEEDRATRGGKRDNIELGYGGLECVHCRRTPSARKFFWSNVDRLSNSFSEIPGHVLKCKACPESTKKALLEVKKYHSSQMTGKSRGSQKTFLRRVWRRMHVDISSESSDCERHDSTELLPVDSIVTLGSDSPDTRHIRDNLRQVATTGGMSCEVAAKALLEGTRENCIPLAIDQDKDWGLSDLDCFVRQNVEIFCATATEAAFHSKEKGEGVVTGQVGIRCINCINCSSTHEVYTAFPAALDDLFSAVRAFKSKHLSTCPNLQREDKEKFEKLAEKSSSSFGSIVRQYYLKSAEALGLRDSPRGGIKATGHQGGFKNDF